VAGFVARFRNYIAACVVGIRGTSAIVRDLTQATDAVRTSAAAVPSEGLVLAGAWVADGQGSVEGVPGACFSQAAGIGTGQQIAGGVIGGIGRAAVGGDFLRDVAEAVDGKSGLGVVRRLDLGKLVAGIIGQCSQAGQRIGNLRRAVEGVVLGAGVLALGVGDRLAVAVGVVAISGGVVDGVACGDGVLQTTEGVVLGVGALGGAATGVAPGGSQNIACGIEGEVDGIQKRVADRGQTECGIVTVSDFAGVRPGNAGGLADGVVVVDRDLPGDAAGLEPAARCIGEVERNAVGVDDGKRTTVLVVGRELGGVAEGVGDAGQIAERMAGSGIAIVGIGGLVENVGSRTVDC